MTRPLWICKNRLTELFSELPEDEFCPWRSAHLSRSISAQGDRSAAHGASRSLNQFVDFKQTTKLRVLARQIGVICRGRNSYDRPSGSALGLLTGHKPDSPEQKTGGREGPEKSEQKLCCHHGRKHSGHFMVVAS